MLAFGEDRFQEMLIEFASIMPKPRAVIAVSAHSLSEDDLFIQSAPTHKIQHDYSGFPPELYKLEYNCPGDPALAETVGKLLLSGGFKIQFDPTAKLDHGVWIPLMHLYPKADVPVIRISLPQKLLPAQILKMGHALASLREDGVLILASGGAVHNLSELQWSQKNSEGKEWAKNFESFVIEALKHKDVNALITAEEILEFKQAHPTLEHFFPLLFAVGATLPNDEVKILLRGIEYASLSMLCFSLNHAQQPLH